MVFFGGVAVAGRLGLRIDRFIDNAAPADAEKRQKIVAKPHELTRPPHART